jgi:hypothetical protein
MNKEKMQQIIISDLPHACNGATGYVYGKIPRDKFINARDAYAGSYVDYDDVIGLIDDTVFGGARRGFLFTYDGYYYDGCDGMRKYNSTFNSLSSLYNLTNFNNMLKKLCEACNESEGGLLDSVLDLGKALLGDFINTAVEQASNEIAEQANQESEDLVEAFENFRDTLDGDIHDIEEWIQKIEEGQADFDELSVFSIQMAGYMNGDTDLVLENIEIDDENESVVESITSLGEYYGAIAELVDDESEGRESVHFSRSLKRFRSDVKKILGARNPQNAEKAIDIMEKSFHRLVDALDDAKDRLNELIDDEYELMD